MDEELDNLARRYALTRRITLGEPLGFGIHGIVFAAQDNAKPGFLAIKFHREDVPFARECRAYRRLQEERVVRVLGFNVPQLLKIDEEWHAIDKEEMFGEKWPRVTEVLTALRAYGIHLLDINPANIAFGERSG